MKFLYFFPNLLLCPLLLLILTACNSSLSSEYQTLTKENKRLQQELEASKKTVDSLLNINIPTTSATAYTFDNFHITGDRVGIFSKGITVADLYSLLPKEQIKKSVDYGEFADDTYDVYKIFDANGKHLLSLSPNKNGDNSAKIKSITVVDPRFMTSEKIGRNTTYGELKKTYIIEHGDTTVDHVYYYVEYSSARFFFSIKKTTLPEGVSGGNQIVNNSDTAHFDSFIISWN